jgi:hypothetical protein
MELPGGLGTLKLGTIEAQPIETAQGVLAVEALGYQLHIARNGTEIRSQWLLPRRVTLTRPSGQVEQAPVHDGAGRVSIALMLSGLALALGSLLVSRK